METNPADSPHLVVNAYESAKRACLDPTIFSVGDWNIRSHVGDMSSKKITD